MDKSSKEYKFFKNQVKNLSVARDMVKSLAVEAQASREANGLLIMQKGEGMSLEKIKYVWWEVSWGLVTFAYHFRAAADEMQECSASIVLKYLQVRSGNLLRIM